VEWRPIGWDDIPARDDLAAETLALLRKGVTNSDRMRDAIRRTRKLILSKATGRWSDSPSDRFVNEHAWVLENLVVSGSIERVGDKEYRIV